MRNSFHYAAVHLASIAETARDVDFAMRWGFGMKQGPFELWQESGWLQVAQWIQEDIAAGKALSKAPLPDWVFKGPVADAGGVHTPQGSWNPTAGKFEQRRVLPDIGVTVGMRRFGWSSEKAAVIGLSASIPLFDRNQSGVEAARERAKSAGLRLDAARLTAQARQRSARAAASHRNRARPNRFRRSSGQ